MSRHLLLPTAHISRKLELGVELGLSHFDQGGGILSGFLTTTPNALSNRVTAAHPSSTWMSTVFWMFEIFPHQTYVTVTTVTPVKTHTGTGHPNLSWSPSGTMTMFREEVAAPTGVFSFFLKYLLPHGCGCDVLSRPHPQPRVLHHGITRSCVLRANSAVGK